MVFKFGQNCGKIMYVNRTLNFWSFVPLLTICNLYKYKKCAVYKHNFCICNLARRVKTDICLENSSSPRVRMTD